MSSDLLQSITVISIAPVLLGLFFGALWFEGRREKRAPRGETKVVDPMDPRVQAQIDEIRPLGVWLDARAAEELLDVMIGLKRRLGSRTSIRERQIIMQFNERVKETRR